MDKFQFEKQNLIKYIYIPFLSLFFAFVTLPTITIKIFGVRYVESFQFISYVLVYHALNGYLIFPLASKHIPNDLRIPSILLFGMSYNILTFFLLSLFGFQKYSFLNIIVSAFIWLKYVKNKNYLIFISTNYKKFLQEFLVMIFILIVIFIPSSFFIFLKDPDWHMDVQGLFSASVLNNKYPYEYLSLDIPLFYNFGYHMDMAFCHLVTTIPLEVLSSKIYPFYILFFLSYLVYAFAKTFFERQTGSGLLVLIFVFSATWFDNISTGLFLNWFAVSGSLLGSTTLSLIFFFVMIPLVYSYIKNNDMIFLDYLFFFLFSFVGSMSRSSFSLVLLGGLFFYILIIYSRRWQLSEVRTPIALGIVGGTSFLFSLVLVYGILSPYSATGFIKFVHQDTMFVKSYINDWVSLNFSDFFERDILLLGRIIAFSHLLFIAGYLTIGFYYIIYKWYKLGINNIDLLLLSCAFTGIVIWNFTESPGASHYPFLYYSTIIFGIFGARGTYLLFQDIWVKKSMFIYSLGAVSTLFMSLKCYEVYKWSSTLEFKKLSFWSTPHYSDIHKSLLQKVSQTTQGVDSSVLIPIGIPSTLTLNMYTKKVCAKDQLLRLGQTPNLKMAKNRLMELLNLFYTVDQTNCLDKSTLSGFKALFPENQIFFLVHDTIKVDSPQLKLISNENGVKILKHTFKSD